MSSYTVINKIKEVSLKSNNKHIQTKIASEYQVLALKDFFGSIQTLHERKIDIPIDNIVALSRKHDTWYYGDSWIDVLVNHLHGTDWSEDVFGYCEDSLFKKEFPAPGARGYLELTSYNGLTLCDNGNHRLPAMVCWLSSKHDHSYELKDVSVNLVPFDKKRIECFKTFYSNSTLNIHLFIGKLTDYQKELFDVQTSQIFFIDNKMYSFSEETIRLLFEKKDSFIDQVKRYFNPEEARSYTDKKKQSITDLNHEFRKESWLEIPNYLLVKLLDDTWFDDIYIKEKNK